MKRWHLMWHLTLILALTVVAVVVFSACGESTAEEAAPSVGPTRYESLWLDTIDGRTIPCVVYKNVRAGGIDCDWSPR
jgi:hypothetical protein